MKILTCVGTRPNFVKVSRLKDCFRASGVEDYKLLHTGQHFDKNMSKVFFEELRLGKPDYFLGAKGSTQIELISDIMVKLEKVVEEWKPDWMLVPGDVNSTLACSLVANRKSIKLAHIESGLRSFDRSMPEEINRQLVDDLADLFLVTEQSGYDNLLREGKPANNIVYTGNSMIDSLVMVMDKIDRSEILENVGIRSPYALVTVHRPSNVDEPERLEEIIDVLNMLSERIQVLFPVHPRTSKNLQQVKALSSNVIVTSPLGYVDFLKAMKSSKFVITDSGGVQEETTYLGIPCLTLRPNTERPSTIEHGTNELISLDTELIVEKVDKILSVNWKTGGTPKYWDGKASERIVNAVLNYAD